MEMAPAAVLPYRTEAQDLVRLIEARARGRSFPQIRALGFSAKNFEGTVQAAQALGFLHSEAEELTESGRRFALAAPADRPRLLRVAMAEFEPYGLLLEATSAPESAAATEIAWIERWWATHGYGSSESNRAEAAAVFGRLVDYVGLGSYIPGRRGHPTRIEWRRESRQVLPLPSADTAAQAAATEPPPGFHPLSSAAPEGTATPPAATLASGYSTATLEIGAGQMAQISVPSTLTRAEKERLLHLLDLLIRVAPGA